MKGYSGALDFDFVIFLTANLNGRYDTLDIFRPDDILQELVPPNDLLKQRYTDVYPLCKMCLDQGQTWHTRRPKRGEFSKSAAKKLRK